MFKTKECITGRLLSGLDLFKISSIIREFKLTARQLVVLSSPLADHERVRCLRLNHDLEVIIIILYYILGLSSLYVNVNMFAFCRLCFCTLFIPDMHI